MATITVEQAFQLATGWQRAGQFAAAANLFRQIVIAQPDHAGALHALGLIATASGRLSEATDWLSKAVVQSPANAIYHADLAISLRYSHRVEEAIASYQRALELDPNFTEVHNNLAEALVQADRLPEAIASAQRALSLRPDYADALNNLGRAQVRVDKLDAALASFRRALELRPDFADLHKNLSAVLSQKGLWKEAVASGERAVALNPRDAECQSNLGAALRGLGDFERALRCFRVAVFLREDFVDAHWNLACLLLLLGRYAEGWREFEWREKFFSAQKRNFSVPRWNGKPAPGKTLLVYAEQGCGDTFQFLRYLPLVRECSEAAQIVFECQPELFRLLQESDIPGVEVITRDRVEALPEFDLQVPLLSLPLVVGQVAPEEMEGPYLQANAALRRSWRERLGAANVRRVGLVWAGHRLFPENRQRSLEPQLLLPLLRVPGIQFYSLQVESHKALPSVLAEAGVLDLAADLHDFADTAALLAELDLVITVDTAVAHLAGALGCPVWTLLSFVPDWRWELNSQETSWYATMRLFRQKSPGDWPEVIERVCSALELRCEMRAR